MSFFKWLTNGAAIPFEKTDANSIYWEQSLQFNKQKVTNGFF